jgi:hypothetical protein
MVKLLTRRRGRQQRKKKESQVISMRILQLSLGVLLVKLSFISLKLMWSSSNGFEAPTASGGFIGDAPSSGLSKTLASFSQGMNKTGPNKQAGNRTLVILVGGLRCGEIAWDSLYRNVLDVNSADLMVSTSTEIPEIHRNASVFSRAKYVYRKPEYDDWGDALNLIDSKWRDKVLPFYNTESILLGLIKVDGKVIRGSGALVFYERWFIAQKIKELGLTKKYDRFVLTRSDHSYMCPLDLSTMDNSKVWVPEGEDWRGICDRFFVANSSSILPALDMLPALFRNASSYADLLGNSITNTETYLLRRWQEENLSIGRFERNMYVCAVEGDSTRWRKPEGFASNTGVLVKYGDEYNLSVDACRLNTTKMSAPSQQQKKGRQKKR